MAVQPIGQILLAQTTLTREQLSAALRAQQEGSPRQPIGQILVEKGYVRPEELARALALQWKLPFLETIGAEQLQSDLVRKLPLEFLKKQCMVPIKLESGQHAIVLADPLNVEAYDAALNVLGEHCPRIISSASIIDEAISRCYYDDVTRHSKPRSDEVQEIHINPAEPTTTSAQPEDLLNIANKAPVIKLVNTIFFQAVHTRASDIHIEPYEHDVKVRFRIDGVLHEAFTIPQTQLAALVSRLKIMGRLNIAERRLPQDGQSRIKIGDREMDVRISLIPTSGGERVVLRLLDKGVCDLGLEQLGFDPPVEECFRQFIHMPHGIILLTGPTGSGKTTTLYAAVNELNDQQRNILTVEDPIEYQLPGVGQMQVKPKINLTFANCLRHILRQDPDVIMIGEIRDIETAEIAIQASLTGHLVLSTLHTNDSASAVTRLLDMGIEPYLISSSVLAIMAQRLLRVICPHCKTICTDADLGLGAAESMAAMALRGPFYRGTGCPHCLNTGYFGRTGIFELLMVDDAIKELVVKRTGAHIIKQAAVEKGMRTLRDDGLRKARAGETTLEEVLRVTQDKAALELRENEHALV